MKRLIIILFALAPLAAGAQDNRDVEKGWRFNPMPVIGYNSDLGFKLGAMCDIYYYPERTPGYYNSPKHKFNVEASYYFRGSGVFNFLYDSEYLIPGKIRFTFAATYLPDPVMSFYGFGGAASPWHKYLDRRDGTAFYSMKRDVVRVLADFSGRIAGPLSWAAGATFWDYRIGNVSIEKYSGNASNSLYNLYQKYGLITPGEARGGKRLEFKAGLVYKSGSAYMRGIRAEAIVYGSPDVFQKAADYLKLAVHFRHYVPLTGGYRVVLAYHLAYQGTIAGDVPFYMQSNILPSNIATPDRPQVDSEGLGSVNTVRGLLYNRLVGDGIAWANAEVRIGLASFDFIGQQWYLTASPFFDAGAVVQPFRLERMREVWNDVWIPASERALIYSGLDEYLHASAGLGFRLYMNRYFIVSAEWAKPFARQDGPGALYVGLSHVF